MSDLAAVTTALDDGDMGWTATVELQIPGRVVELSISGDSDEVVAQVIAWTSDRSRWDPRNHQHVLYTGKAPARTIGEFKRV